MSRFEDPIQFDINKKIGDAEIAYSDLMEISQGGPVIGNLWINGKMVDGRFGGPAFCEDEYVFVPVLVKKIFGSGFRLARVNINTLETAAFGKIRDLIFLNKLVGNRVYFFEDINKTMSTYYDI